VIGWLAYSLMGFLGMLAVVALWAVGRWRPGCWVLIIAAGPFLAPWPGCSVDRGPASLRACGGVDSAGYVFRDAYTRDSQAWSLAASSDSILKAFDNPTAWINTAGSFFWTPLCTACSARTISGPGCGSALACW